MILLRSFLTLLENLKYLQCVSITRKLFSVKKKLKFENVTLVSILRILKEFKAYKATEVENIMRRFLKDSSNILCTPIAKICNLSIILASFPDKYKVSFPDKSLYKKGLKSDLKNFRPISLLPLISKIIYRVNCS